MIILFLSLWAMTGCGGGPAPAAGGTSGTLKFGDQVTSDMIVHVFKKNGIAFEETGFGTTQADGTFVLYKPGASGPLFLEAGEYSFTLESVGPDAEIPTEFLNPETTPLRENWSTEKSSLDLQAPEKILTGA